MALLLVLVACPVTRTPRSYAGDVAPAGIDASAHRLGAWASFKVSFDADTRADLAAGPRSPVSVEGSPVLEAGRFGRALRLGVGAGGARVDYPLAGNVEFAQPGGLSFWVSPRGWRDRTPSGRNGTVRFLRVTSRDRSVLVVQRDARRADRDRIMVGFSDSPKGESYFLDLATETSWREGEWHLIVLAWDDAAFAVSIDGGPFSRKAVPIGRLAASFGKPGPKAVLALGDPATESTLIDEIVGFTRPLRDEDAATLWAVGPREPDRSR